MSDNSHNSKRIAKNTLLLYIRMLCTLFISLYTSRIVLNALGVEDYGIYNVVGGVVGMFSIISGSLSAAISRYITYELGKNNLFALKKVFSTAITIQLILSSIILILAEIVGIWFINNKMNIPANRIFAANWVFQLSVLTFIINLVSVPYNAAIIAHEKMSAFAYISIFDVSAKLLIAYLLLISSIDRLITYALLTALVSIVLRLIYGFYCKRNFGECSYNFILDKNLLKKMFGFASWNFIGSCSAILRDQGGNIVINLFCGPTVNAARSIAYQVNSAVSGFVSNFMTAVNPQITKSYASGEHQYMMTLIFQGARFSFYILLLFSIPIIVNTEYILSLWLSIVPEHTVNFIQLVLVFTLSESLSNPLITAMLATGKIRNYQIVIGGLQILNLPISYLLLKYNCLPETIFIVAICISQACLMARLYMLRNMIGIKAKDFLKKVYFNVIRVAFLASSIPIIVSLFLNDKFKAFVLTSSLSITFTIISVLYIGCNKYERSLIFRSIKQLKNKIIPK